MKAKLNRGDYIVVKITKVTEDGAFGYCDEYGVNVFIPAAEITSRKDPKSGLKSAVKVGQTKVVKVLKVRGKDVDASIKRVYDKELKKAIERYRRFKRAMYLYKLVFGDDMKYWDKLEDLYGEVFWAFEDVALYGKDAIKSIIPRKYLKKFEEVAKKHITISRKTVRVELQIATPLGNGVEVLRNVFSKIYEEFKDENTSLRIYTIGAPKYYLDISTYDYKEGNELAYKILEKLEEELKGKCILFKHEFIKLEE